MIYYLDFEAQQYTEKIIAIGCVNEKGETFYSLVNPGNECKVGKKVASLTGIKDDDIKAAPRTDQVLYEFKKYVKETSGGELTFFYTYGSSDGTFCFKSEPCCKKRKNAILLDNIGASIIDKSNAIAAALKKPKRCKLAECLTLLEIDKEPFCAHNALDDAKMLKAVCEKLRSQNKKI